MNRSETLTWHAFKAALLQHPEQILQFEYAADKWVNPDYHITEIKQAPIVSVDCGGVMNTWTEVIVQLWEPAKKEHIRAMKVSKALSIITLVEQKLPLNPNAVVKIEFGNTQYDTRQLYPASMNLSGEDFIINLIPDETQCKALNRKYNTEKSEGNCDPKAGCC